MTETSPTANFVNSIVTCRTDGCENANIGIELFHDPDGSVMCGPCMQPITDIAPAVLSTKAHAAQYPEEMS